MEILQFLFWLGLALIFYTYLGYGILLYFILKIKALFQTKTSEKESFTKEDLPKISLVIPAYNEKEYLQIKVWNSMTLHYPEDKLEIVFVTDGSNDGTPCLLRQYPQVRVLHQDARKGKIAAMNRAMKLIENPIVVFSDANTILHPKTLLEIAKHYYDPKVGAVAGEKRIHAKATDEASGAGEGIYWRYESKLKQMDSALYSVVGAAGELFSIRKELFEEVPGDAILDDFIISLRVAQKGYTVKYEPRAYAVESASASVGEEIKRKIRISAGGIQSILWLSALLNPFKYGTLTFQYVSHRVLRWTLTPLALLWVLITNGLLAWHTSGLFDVLWILQLTFYLLGFTGWLLERQKLKLKLKAFFIPFYFLMMNVCVYLGFLRFIRGNQSVIWEKAKRKQ